MSTLFLVEVFFDRYNVDEHTWFARQHIQKNIKRNNPRPTKYTTMSGYGYERLRAWYEDCDEVVFYHPSQVTLDCVNASKVSSEQITGSDGRSYTRTTIVRNDTNHSSIADEVRRIEETASPLTQCRIASVDSGSRYVHYAHNIFWTNAWHVVENPKIEIETFQSLTCRPKATHRWFVPHTHLIQPLAKEWLDVYCSYLKRPAETEDTQEKDMIREYLMTRLSRLTFERDVALTYYTEPEQFAYVVRHIWADTTPDEWEAFKPAYRKHREMYPRWCRPGRH